MSTDDEDARAYVPPTALPPKTRRDTLELEARVQIAPSADPRRAPTMPRLDVTDDRRPTLRRLKPGEPTPPGPPVVLDEPVPRAAALLPIVDEDTGRSNVTGEALEAPPSSRGKWKTDRLPIVQTPPPPPPGSDWPEAKPKPSSGRIVPVGALLLLAVVLFAWSRLRHRSEEPAPASASSVAPPIAIEPPAPIAEPAPPPVVATPEKTAEPSAKASAKPRAIAPPSAKPAATLEPAPALSASTPSPPSSAAPSAKPEPPELVQ